MRKELEQSFMRLMFNARNRIRFAMDDKLKPLNITDATWRTLYFLRQSGNGVQQKELARIMAIEGPSLVRLLDKLEEKQLIERRTDPDDRRSKTIHIAEGATELLVNLDEHATEVRATLLESVSDEELDTCVGVLIKVMESKAS